MIEERLIEEVRKHVSLYDVTATEYRDQKVRRLAWEEIGKNLKMSAEKCKNEWNKLRNCFTNSVRRRIGRNKGTTTTTTAKAIPPWRYSHHMEFLLPFVEVKGSYTNIIADDEGSNEQSSALECSETIVSPSVKAIIDDTDESLMSTESTLITADSEPLNSTDVAKCPQPLELPAAVCISKREKVENANHKKKKRKRQGNDVGQTISRCNRFDEIEMFYISMAKIARRLPQIEEARLRQEVCALVSNAEITYLENASIANRYSANDYSSSTNSDIKDEKVL